VGLLGLGVTILGAIIVVAVTAGSLQAQMTSNQAAIERLQEEGKEAASERADNHRNIRVVEERLLGILQQLEGVVDRLERKVPDW
jgi:hypothetical protein